MNSLKLGSNLIVFYLIEEKEASSKVLNEGVFYWNMDRSYLSPLGDRKNSFCLGGLSRIQHNLYFVSSGV